MVYGHGDISSFLICRLVLGLFRALGREKLVKIDRRQGGFGDLLVDPYVGSLLAGSLLAGSLAYIVTYQGHCGNYKK